MISLTDVLIDALWVLGLAGVFATFSYMDYYRRLLGWRWRDAWSRPRLLAPLSLSLFVFSVGVGLNGATAFQPDPWWQTALWAVMGVLFAWQTVIYWMAGRRRGWDRPLEDESEVAAAKPISGDENSEQNQSGTPAESNDRRSRKGRDNSWRAE